MDSQKPPDPGDVLRLLGERAQRLPREELALFLRELLGANRRLGLVSKRDAGGVAARLVERSLELMDFFQAKATGLPRGPEVADIGPGGGFPGLVWKLAWPEIRLSLVERSEKRAAFLAATVAMLGLSGVEVVEEEAAMVCCKEGYAGRFHAVTAMAVAPPERLAAVVWRLLGEAGYFCTIGKVEEKVFEGLISPGLRLESAIAGQTGVFLLYRKIAAGCS